MQQTLIVELAQSLVQNAEYAAVLAFTKHTEQKCGTNKELLPIVFAAQINSSDFIGAEATADTLITEYPADSDAFGWRSEARERRGNLHGAYLDLRKALYLFPNPAQVSAQVYYDVARLAAKTGQACEALAMLRDYIAFDPVARRTQQLATLMDEWQKQGSCASPFGIGKAFLRYDLHAPSIIVPVEINGVQCHMLLDTGASRTELTKSLAERAGIQPSADLGETIYTANGDTWVAGGRADRISLAGASASNVPVYIQGTEQGTFGEDVDGLLGLSFLGNFQIKLNNGILELRPIE